jgi:hypothetical protein
MTLPASGSISLSQVSVELGRASNANTKLGESAVRTLAGVASGAISLGNLRGKSAYTPMIGVGHDGYNSFMSTYSGGTATCSPYVTVSNGSGGYTYSWSFTSNPNSLTLANATSSQCTVSKTFTKLSSWSMGATLQCVISDNTGHSITVSNINASMDVSDS